MLPLKLHIGANYKLNSKVDVGILARGLVTQSRIYPSVILSANTNFARFFSGSVTYSYNNYSFNNLGLGLSFQSKHLQYYIIRDNYWGLLRLSLNNVNFRFGVNLLFGCYKKKKSEDHIGCPWFNLKQNEHSKKSPYLTGKLSKGKGGERH